MKFLILFFTLIIFSCSSNKEKIENAETAYIKAYQQLKDKNYAEAAKNFEKIEDDYPFSNWSSKAQTMAAYAYYKNRNYPDIIRVVDDFVRINPTNLAISYMVYLKALSYYDQIPDIERSQDSTKLASVTFRELIARFPESEYADDAREKLVDVDEHLAGAKMSVARYQISQKNYVGAIKNCHEVVSRYGYTNQAAEGYFRLGEIYYKVGLNEEAKKTQNILNAKFPDSEWTKLLEEIKIVDEKKSSIKLKDFKSSSHLSNRGVHNNLLIR